MDMGDGKYFLEETSLGLVNPLTMENLKERLEKRLSYRNISITSMQHEELGLFLPMNMPIPDFKQQILGYGGAASMVHPASGYLIGNVLRRAPLVAKAVSEAIKNKKLKVDSYGCGDSFAAGILYGMASKWDIDKSLNLAKVMGRDASEFFGPYANNDEK